MTDTEKLQLRREIEPSAINPTIAELLEPRPEFGAIGDEYLGEGRIGRAVPRFCSPLGVWVWFPEVLRWQPLDFLHDARGTVMLLERLKMKSVGLRYDTSGQGMWIISIPYHYERSELAPVIHHELGEAVAHAFLRANGIEVSE